jgi:secreted trypsin-like serine protease
LQPKLMVAMSRTKVALAAAATLAALLLGGLSPAAAGAASAQASVVNGVQALSGSFPYLAFVYFREGSEGEACTGTVVSSNVILTAAHCVLDEEHGVLRSPAGYRVVTGNVDWTSAERVVSTVSAVAVYPEYMWSGEYAHWGDAAVLQLSQPIAAPPVKLASSEAWTAGTSALMAGWGKVSASQSGPSTGLRYGSTAVQSATYCASKTTRFHASGQLCVLDAPNRVYSVCNGDSGGPLLIVNPGTANEPLEIGIASFVVNGGCSPSSPQYYSRADLVLPWVAAQIAAAAPPPSPPPAPAPAPVTTAPPTPTLPQLGGRAAKGYVKAALSQALGYRFNRRRDYQASCEVLETTKRSCAVGWRGAAFLYSGWVTVFYALEANRVVWRYSYRVKRTAVGCEGSHCPARVFHGRVATKRS